VRHPLIDHELVEHVGLVVDVEAAVRRIGDWPYKMPQTWVLPGRGDLLSAARRHPSHACPRVVSVAHRAGTEQLRHSCFLLPPSAGIPIGDIADPADT
jgi:hypothetical protein